MTDLVPGAGSGLGEPLRHLALFHYALAASALLVAGIAARWPGRAPAVAATVWAAVAVAYWPLVLARPYGLLVDPDVTRWSADMAVYLASGSTEGFVVGLPGTGPGMRLLAALGPLALWLASFAPVLFVLATAPLAALVAGRGAASIAVVLWAAAAIGELQIRRGMLLMATTWADPAGVVRAIALLLVVLLLDRWLPRTLNGRLVTAVATVGIAVASGGGSPLTPPATLLLLTLDQWPWGILALAGLRRGPDRVRVLLIGSGGAVVVGSFLGQGAWTGYVAYRLALLAMAAHGVVALRDAMMAGRPAAFRRRVTAGAVFAVLAGSPLAWFDPPSTDPVAAASLVPVSEPLLDAMAWIRGNTPAEAVFVAEGDDAAAVAVLAGRRVLRSALRPAPDDDHRWRTAFSIVNGRRAARLRQRYRVSYVFCSPGSLQEYKVDDPDALAGRAGLRMVYRNDAGMRVYALPALSSPFQ